MKFISTERVSVSLLSGLMIILLAGCGGSSSVTDGGGGNCSGATCNGVGGGGGALPGSPTVSIAAANGQNILTMAPGAGTSASTFNIYWSTSPTVTVTTGTKISSVQSPFQHTGLTNGIPIFYVVTSDLSTGPSFPSGVAGGMPGTWFQVNPSCSPSPCSAATLPAARDSHTAVYDSTSNKMIVFGGKVAGAPENDLWSLQNASGTSPTWTQLLDTNLPPKRLGHTAVYNDQGNQMTVFGGALDSNGDQLTNDLWGLPQADATGSHWNSLSGGSPPTHRWGHAAVYDLTADTMIVFGGIEQTGQSLLSEVWVLRQMTTSPIWQQITPSGGPPSARCCMAAGYDAANRRMIIFGGFGGSALFADLWTLTFDSTFSTATWQQLTPSAGTPPAARCCGVGLWDGSQFLVFGGGQFGNPSSDDTVHALVLDATTFSSADGPGGGPVARTFPTAVPAGRLLLFGGSSASAALNDLWQLK